MKTRHLPNLKGQRGAASLLTSLVILICITLVTFFTAKAVLVETQIAADNNRAAQALAAANSAKDFAVAYFDDGGWDHDGDGIRDDIDPAVDTAGVGGGHHDVTSFYPTTRLVFDNNNPNCSTANDMKSGLIIATGFSDDNLAQRVIQQCVGPLNLLNDDGPEQPLIAQGNVNLTGNAHIINRYTNINVWSGDSVVIGSSSSMSTYIKNPASGALTLNELLDSDESNNTQLVSNRNLGNGLDIIDADPSLGTLVGLEFFKNFFAVDNRDQVKQLAIDRGQYYTAANIGNAIGKSGVIWIEGNALLNSNGTIGSIAKPAILIVNGNLTTAGTPTVYGVVYVVGKYNVGGTVTIIGASIVEGTDLATGNPAAPPIVYGNGTLNLVFWPAFGPGSGNPIPGLTSVVSGSWRDW
ncbi:MAG: hypothetical protein ACU83N_13195 [Gammaproteobacteria bacterium]